MLLDWKETPVLPGVVPIKSKPSLLRTLKL